MNTETLWAVERRRLDQEAPHRWSMTACAVDREEAEYHYNRHKVYIQSHEMRLLAPNGEVVRYFRDPSDFSTCVPSRRHRRARTPCAP